MIDEREPMAEDDFEYPENAWMAEEDLCSCGRETAGESCGQCAAPLCPMCLETGAGFCSKHPAAMIDESLDGALFEDPWFRATGAHPGDSGAGGEHSATAGGARVGPVSGATLLPEDAYGELDLSGVNRARLDALVRMSVHRAYNQALSDAAAIVIGDGGEHERDCRAVADEIAALAVPWSAEVEELYRREAALVDIRPRTGQKGSPPFRRIQRRSKDWRKPPGTISVTRPGRWSNPFPLPKKATAHDLQLCRSKYLAHLDRELAAGRLDLDELRGYQQIMCWCPLDAEWCHGDELIRRLNAAD